MSTLPPQNKDVTVIQQLAKQQAKRQRSILVGTLVTDPSLKYILGPDAVAPLEEGSDLESHPQAVLTWFADVRLANNAGGGLLQDAIVTYAARQLVGKKGSPVLVQRNDSSGRWEVVGRADRVTEFQSYETFNLFDLGLEFIRGVSAGGNSAFYDELGDDNANLLATRNGHSEAGANRGVTAWLGSVPILSQVLRTYYELVPFDELEWGVDPFGVQYLVTVLRNGTTTRVKV